MARNRWRRLDEKLSRLDAVKADPASDGSVDLLRKFLADKSNLLVARAAKVIAELEVTGFEDDLVQSFDRFREDPATRDGGCKAKTAIVDALRRIGHCDPNVFLLGIRTVQMEPAYGGPVDTAVDLRCLSALGLVGAQHPDLMVELARLLADREPRGRIGAVRAMACSGREDALPLLYFKVLSGDEEPAVTGECFDALLALSPDDALPFVAEFLRDPDPRIGEAAALALGESRIPEAFKPIRATLEAPRMSRIRTTLLLAMAMLRTEEATEFLMGLIREGPRESAADAIAAFGMYRYDDELRHRVHDLATCREDPLLLRVVNEVFG